MKKIFSLVLFGLLLVNCSRAPSQEEIDKATKTRLNNIQMCEDIGQSLDSVVDYRKDSCYVYKKSYLSNPIAVFEVKELSSVLYYIAIEEIIHLTK